MADPATATRASAPAPAVPYVGSRISLISKSAIRYVGTLYTIDTKASTVALKDVRSFGTEGRPREGGPVDPSDRIYSFIVFHGRDILDLQFLTTDAVPAPTSPASAAPPVKETAPLKPAPEPVAEPLAVEVVKPVSVPVPDPTPPPRAPLRGPTPRAWGPPPAAPRHEAPEVLSRQYDETRTNTTNAIPHINAPRAEANGVMANGHGRSHRDTRPRGRGRGRSAPNGGRNPAGGWRRGPGITIPDEDFDFALMQEKFNKASLTDSSSEAGHAGAFPQVEVRYDKSKSFFDELVPEKEMRTERYNAAQRRATDFETFGETGPGYHNNRSGYRNGRGRRGRGRGRGRARYGGGNAGIVTDGRGDASIGRNAAGRTDSR